MLDAKAFGNAAAIVTAAIYFVCVAFVIVAPDLAFNYFTLTFHGLNTKVLRPSVSNLDIVRVLIGAVTTTISSWIVFYAGAYVYNNLKGK